MRWKRCSVAADELTGLIGAAALMRLSKSVMDIEAGSVRKKFKDKKFAAGCSRDVIAEGAQRLGWELTDLTDTLRASAELRGEHPQGDGGLTASAGKQKPAGAFLLSAMPRSALSLVAKL